MTSYRALRRRTYEVLEKAGAGDRLSAVVDLTVTAVIVANIAAVVLESFSGMYDRYRRWFDLVELVSVALFTVEYVLRLWTCEFARPQRSRAAAVALFVVSPIGLIDLIAILPFYLPFLIPVDLRVVRVLRLVRFLRLLKLARYTRSLAIMGTVLRERGSELLTAVFLTSLLLVVASTLMFYMEHDVQPEAFPNIVASLWWAVATLTTIGYGDVFPVTGWGRLLSGVIAVLGIGLVALPTAIISSGFIEALARRRPQATPEDAVPPPAVCPHCGQPLDSPPERTERATGS
jgi:voltage-gated potassium channel